MAEKNSENNESIIDLTNCSYTLADHCNLANEVINLDTDDSICEVVFNQSNNASNSRSGRKRRFVFECLRTPIITNRKRSTRVTIAFENTTVTEEPSEEPKVKKAKYQTGCCPICFEEFGGQPLATTNCGHVFCSECLKLALSREPRCPTCRTILKGKSKYHPIFL